MFESFVDLASGSAWTYGLVFTPAALDVLLPISSRGSRCSAR